MTDEDDLFAELDIPSVVVEKVYSNENKMAETAWAHWSNITDRPQQRNPDRDFIKMYKGLLADGHKHGLMLTVISGAARMPVRPRDPKDLKRLKYALSSPNGTKEALALVHEKDRAVVPFPDSTAPVFKSTITDLEEACRVNHHDWTSSDHDAAATLVERYTAEELNTLADETARTLGVTGILPSDMVRNSASAGAVKKNAKAEVYNAGRSEEDEYGGIRFAADNLAEQMRRRGASAAAIRQVHDQAPEGYWDAVINVLIDEPTRTFASVYDQIEKKFKWHPKSRSEEQENSYV